MYRILVFGMTENPGGIESFLMSYYRNIDRGKIQFDFLCNSYNPIAYEKEINNLGGRCFHIIARSKNYRKYKEELQNIFQKYAKEWEAIWVNVCSLANIDYLKFAKKYGIRRRIIHSHNSANMDNGLRGLLHIWNRRNVDKFATDYWACSKDAACWFYDEKIMSKVIIIHNAIDVRKMQFNETTRQLIREKYSWGDRKIIGNVGRLHFQKNQLFIIDIFNLICKKIPDAILVLIGQGEDEEKIRKKIDDLKIQNSVYMMGLQSNISDWLSTFDLFLFPSIFEGLSISAMEAQASGVPILASDNVIPSEVKMNDNFCFLSLNENAESWAKNACNMLQQAERIDYKMVKKAFEDAGYDIVMEAKKLEKILVNG